MSISTNVAKTWQYLLRSWQGDSNRRKDFLQFLQLMDLRSYASSDLRKKNVSCYKRMCISLIPSGNQFFTRWKRWTLQHFPVSNVRIQWRRKKERVRDISAVCSNWRTIAQGRWQRYLTLKTETNNLIDLTFLYFLDFGQKRSCCFLCLVWRNVFSLLLNYFYTFDSWDSLSNCPSTLTSPPLFLTSFSVICVERR